MKKIVSLVTAIAAIVFIVSIVGNSNDPAMIESDSDLRYILFVLFIDWVANRILFIFEELTHEKA